ncbi:MAG TPA: pyridoxal phosphate-dependent aminotransferase [Thermoanaerobaculia bacterium]|jgi:aminotransferase|nr:pyridoxal phosphate-dependent aminotransferase [Thermoanaerobaculia bacterium]
MFETLEPQVQDEERQGPAFMARALDGFRQSEIRRMTRECERVNGINLGQGICDLPTPSEVLDSAIAAMRSGKNTYSYAEGILALRQAISEKLLRDNGIVADPRTEISVTIGATGGYVSTINALLNKGDGILIFEPYYGYHVNSALIGGFEPQFVELEAPSFAIHAEAIRRAIRPNTRAIVLCTPNNPSGKMLDEADLRAVEEVANEHNLLVITDEIYEYIRFDGRPHISPASFGELRSRTVSIMGLSKIFSITGWRLGYVAAPEPLARLIALVNDLYYVCAPTPLQHGVIDGFNLPPSYIQGLQAEYQEKRDLVCGALADAGFTPVVPQGAYYVLADISRLGFDNASQAAMALLENCHVAAVPGTSFFRGRAGEKFLRFCFAVETGLLEEACRRIRTFA